MHWIEIGDVPEIWDRYESVGLTTVQCGDGARNVLECLAAGLDNHECFDAQPFYIIPNPLIIFIIYY